MGKRIGKAGKGLVSRAGKFKVTDCEAILASPTTYKHSFTIFNHLYYTSLKPNRATARPSLTVKGDRSHELTLGKKQKKSLCLQISLATVNKDFNGEFYDTGDASNRARRATGINRNWFRRCLKDEIMKLKKLDCCHFYNWPMLC